MKQSSKFKFNKILLQNNIDERLIDEIMNVSYTKADNVYQDDANFYYAALKKCDESLGCDVVIDLMSDMCCSCSGKGAAVSKEFAKKHASGSFEEKIKKLADMGQPYMIDGNHIGAYITNPHEARCSCGRFNGCKPENGIMPISYCYCCAGFLKFHYEIKLGVKLKIEKMLSSFLSTGERCSVIFKIVG